MKYLKGGLLAVALIFITSGVTYAATSNYYADLLYGQKEQMQEELEQVYKMTGAQVHHDMVQYVETKRNEILDDAKEQIREDAIKRMNDHTAEINRIAEQLEKELLEGLND